MDSGITWFSDIYQKTETFFSEMEAISQEQLKHVENELKIAGGNVKQFYSDFIHDMFNSEEEKKAPQGLSSNLESSVKESNNNLPIKKRCVIEENSKAATMFQSDIDQVISSSDESQVIDSENENDTSLSHLDAVSEDHSKDVSDSADSCIIIDSKDTCSAWECEANHLYHQKSIRRAFSSMLRFRKDRKHKGALTEGFKEELLDQDFGESEWEII